MDQFDRKPLLIEADRVLPSHLVYVATLETGVLQSQPRHSAKNGFRLEVREAPVRTEVRDDDDRGACVNNRLVVTVEVTIPGEGIAYGSVLCLPNTSHRKVLIPQICRPPAVDYSSVRKPMLSGEVDHFAWNAAVGQVGDHELEVCSSSNAGHQPEAREDPAISSHARDSDLDPAFVYVSFASSKACNQKYPARGLWDELGGMFVLEVRVIWPAVGADNHIRLGRNDGDRPAKGFCNLIPYYCSAYGFAACRRGWVARSLEDRVCKVVKAEEARFPAVGVEFIAAIHRIRLEHAESIFGN